MQSKESGSKKKTTAKSGTKTNTKASAKTSTADKAKTTAPKNSGNASSGGSGGFFAQAAPFIIGALALVLAIIIIIGEGNVGGFVRKLLTGLFGGAAYLLPVFVIVRMFFWNKDSENGTNTAKNCTSLLLFIFVTMFMHIVADGRAVLDAKVHYADGILLRGGGAFGGILGQLLVKGFGRACAVIIIVCAVILAVLYLIGVTPKTVGVFLAYRFGITWDNRKQKRAENEEKRRNASPSRSQVKEEEYLRYLRAKKEKERQEKEREKELAAQTAGEDAEAQKAETKPTEPKTVYHVRKHKVVEIPSEDNTVLTVNSDTGEVLAENKAQETETVIPEQSAFESVSNDGRVESALTRSEREQLIYDEVMKRTRERVEKSKKKNSVSAEISESSTAEAKPTLKDNKLSVVDNKLSIGDNKLSIGDNKPSSAEKKPIPVPAVPVKTAKKSGEASPFDDDYFDEENDGAAETENDEASYTDGFDEYNPHAVTVVCKDDKSDKDSASENSADGDEGVFDAVNLAAQSIQEKLDARREAKHAVENNANFGNVNPSRTESAGKAATIASEYEPDEPEDDEDDEKMTGIYGAYDAAERSEENNVDALDVSGLFVNPEDAELLEKLNQVYRREPTKAVALPETAPQAKPDEKQNLPEYRFPSVELLTEAQETVNENIKEELQENAIRLVDTLKSFKVDTKIENISRGPTITRYELKPEAGTKVRSITNLVDDIALNLATTGVRIEAPIPGKSAVGIEVPNKKQETVHLRSLIEDERFASAKSQLTVCLGADVAGETVFLDIAKMPHLLIAGATGSGKSVCINSIITSLLYKASPEDVKLILIDPKKVEMNIYNGIPHLLVPVVSEAKKAAGALSWAVGEMERRYGLMEEVGMRDIKSFNETTKDNPEYEYMPRIVIIIDELADLMMTAPDDVEDSICRIAQKARAAGMHLIIGTQRPSVDVITGLIKANIPSRIAFRTSSQIDSRTIIDVGQAANLIGMGDMLYAPVGANKPFRVQGAYVSENDVIDVVKDIKEHNSGFGTMQSEKIVNEIEREAQKCGAKKGKGVSSGSEDDEDFGDTDELLPQAIEIAVRSRKIATSLLQRELKIGYGRAARIIDTMEEMGYVSAPNGTKPREVLISEEDYLAMRLERDGI